MKPVGVGPPHFSQPPPAHDPFHILPHPYTYFFSNWLPRPHSPEFFRIRCRLWTWDVGLWISHLRSLIDTYRQSRPHKPEARPTPPQIAPDQSPLQLRIAS